MSIEKAGDKRCVVEVKWTRPQTGKSDLTVSSFNFGGARVPPGNDLILKEGFSLKGGSPSKQLMECLDVGEEMTFVINTLEGPSAMATKKCGPEYEPCQSPEDITRVAKLLDGDIRRLKEEGDSLGSIRQSLRDTVIALNSSSLIQLFSCNAHWDGYNHPHQMQGHLRSFMNDLIGPAKGKVGSVLLPSAPSLSSDGCTVIVGRDQSPQIRQLVQNNQQSRKEIESLTTFLSNIIATPMVQQYRPGAGWDGYAPDSPHEHQMQCAIRQFMRVWGASRHLVNGIVDTKDTGGCPDQKEKSRYKSP